jgi:hypothetical protein
MLSLWVLFAAFLVWGVAFEFRYQIRFWRNGGETTATITYCEESKSSDSLGIIIVDYEVNSTKYQSRENIARAVCVKPFATTS